jgi:ABC-type sugar transport system ATPase subunit
MAKRSKGRFNEPGSPDMGASGSSMSMEMVFNDDVGRKLANRYQITRVIGEGGMGVVYEAYDSQVDRDVAIKVVRSECLSDTKFLTRFRREMEVTTPRRVTWGVRPQHLRLVPQGTPGALTGTIAAVEFMGHEVYLYAHVAGQTVIAVVSGETYDPGTRRGDPVTLKPIEALVHVFDADTGNNLKKGKRNGEPDRKAKHPN